MTYVLCNEMIINLDYQNTWHHVTRPLPASAVSAPAANKAGRRTTAMFASAVSRAATC